MEEKNWGNPNPSLEFPSSSRPRGISPESSQMAGGPPRPPLRALGPAAAFLVGGFLTVSLAASAAIRALQSASESKRRKIAPPCVVCKGKGFYSCKLCKGNSTVQWSPLYDPIVINPCLCPTCDGNRVQRCLNCLGKGYA